MSTSASDPPLGASVEVTAGKGIVRFCGATSFAAGKWIGIELLEPKGKNNGSINGVVYFHCAPNHGVFVRPSQVRLLQNEQEQPRVPASQRTQLGHQRQSSLTRVNSLRSPAQPPSSPSSRATSPAKPSMTASPSLKSTRPTGLGSPIKRTLPSLQPRKSLQRQDSTLPPSPPQSASNRIPSHGTPHKRTSSPLVTTTTPEPELMIFAPAPLSPGNIPLGPRSDVSSPAIPAPPPDDHELQELRAKIRVLEAKRTDDARHIRELETRLTDAESFVALRPKLQAKLNSLQTDLTSTRRELADLKQLSELAESRNLDVQEQLEMAMLDKEMAEEKAEIAQAELEDVKERLAIAEVELEVLKEEQQEGAGEDADGKDSLAYIQLEKHNERLKEALMKLRDISQETEQEQRKRIAELEKDQAETEDIRAQYENTLVMLTNAENQVEDLKVQLDDAMGAEEMLVQLTERNLMLGEKIEEMRITIEDLEALKELSDELEENHIETEKQLLHDLESKDKEIREQTQKIEVLTDSCQDQENTIGQFRELVLQLQSELDTLRTQTQTAQHESVAATSQAAAVMSMNVKLQSTASKNQAKAIEYELAKMDAKECRELLNIVQPYLPQIYIESDTDATSFYFFFQRLGKKMDLINMVIAQVHGLPDSLNGPVSESHAAVCEMRGRISALSILCKRFAAVLRKCDVESFLNIGRLYPDIAPMEKRVDMHIDLLRRDQFREMECISDVVKIHKDLQNIVEPYFEAFEYDIAERELGHLLAFDNDLDIFAASIGLTKTSVATLMKDEDVVFELGNQSIDDDLLMPLQRLLDQYKSAKSLSRKLVKRLEDLIHDSSALKANIMPQMAALSNSVFELVNFGIGLAQSTMPHLNDARSAKSPFQLSTILASVTETASSTVGKSSRVSPWEAASSAILQLMQEGSALLPLIMENDYVIKITGTSPWITRIAEVRAATAINIEAERKLAQLNDEMQGLLRNMKIKDQNIQESSVKIELMERRIEAAKKQSESIAQLENDLAESEKLARQYSEEIRNLQSELQALENENTKLAAANAGKERTGVPQVEPEAPVVEGSLETSYLVEQLEALRGTVRFLRNENAYLKGQDLLKEIEALPPLREPTPPLDPSGASDTDESDSEYSPPTIRSLSTESKLLFRDVVKFSSAPKVVDLSAKRMENKNKPWIPRKMTPAYQILERKKEAGILSQRMKALLERTESLGL